MPGSAWASRSGLITASYDARILFTSPCTEVSVEASALSCFCNRPQQLQEDRYRVPCECTYIQLTFYQSLSCIAMSSRVVSSSTEMQRSDVHAVPPPGKRVGGNYRRRHVDADAVSIVAGSGHFVQLRSRVTKASATWTCSVKAAFRWSCVPTGLRENTAAVF